MRFLLIWLVAASALGLAARADASWYQANSKHFIIYADATPEELRDYGTKLERFDQAVRMARAMDDPPLTDSNRLTIYQLRDPGELVRLTGDPSILGFYVAHARGSLAFVARKIIPDLGWAYVIFVVLRGFVIDREGLAAHSASRLISGASTIRAPCSHP